MDRPVLLSNEHIKQANISSNYGRCIVCKAGFGSPKTSLELMCNFYNSKFWPFPLSQAIINYCLTLETLSALAL